jgi:hypothetical protein
MNASVDLNETYKRVKACLSTCTRALLQQFNFVVQNILNFELYKQ